MSQISAESGETGRESLNGDGFSEDGASTVNLLGGFDLKFGTLVLPEEGLKKQDDTAQASNFKVRPCLLQFCCQSFTISCSCLRGCEV